MTTENTDATPAKKSNVVRLVAVLILVVAVVAVATVLTTSKKSSTASGSSVSFTKIVNYDKSAGVCQGQVQLQQGAKVNSNAKADKINGVFSCATKEILTFIDYFQSEKDRAAITSQKGFITQASCAKQGYKCVLDYDGNWLFVGLVANKPKTLAADITTLKADEATMEPALVNAKA